ncbi:hypothetical protein Esi_0000_0343 [Ectocarpus siliculosus]|uniref:Uncharacterized protein n=1 Tax=Ectocarpus siliculosus TaxID=2880 RepID=D8LBA6_ECTSI|nr:hypothetical protein Esi_0000_0343 [Ectocarpus siliculosus]|eukprot:CBN76615.1 hypothetical protein Esi_0000_0343 [Ectocarpus siliculosus]
MLALTGIERSYASAIGQTMHNLTVQAEVGSVMEGMLGDLEAWEWANKEEVLKKELEHARAQVQALKDSERALLEDTCVPSIGRLRDCSALHSCY